MILGVGWEQSSSRRHIAAPLRIPCALPIMMRMYNTDYRVQIWEPRILRVRTAIRGLDSLCIPFAILKHDPLPPFLHQRGAREQRAGTFTACEAWQQAFAALSEEQRFFLYAWSAPCKASPRMVEAAALIVGIATPGPHYKRWLTTYALSRQSEVVAWRVEIAMLPAPERVTEIVLSEENMLRLCSPHPSI